MKGLARLERKTRQIDKWLPKTTVKKSGNYPPLSLAEFIREAWHVVEPSRAYQHNWHIDAIAEHLTAVTEGHIRNLVINIPPGFMKSLAVCVFWPCWEWAELTPSTRWIFSSYAQRLAIRDSRKCRMVIQSPWYQERYGSKFKLTTDQNEKGRFENDATGFRLATSVGGLGTGERADRIIVDDPHKVTEAESDTIRQSAVDWWQTEMSTRGSDPDKSSRVVIMQRVHESDVSGVVLAQGGYEHLCLPMEYEPSRQCLTSIGWEDPRRELDELLWGDRFGLDAIADLKMRLGSYGYAGQCQQSPSPLAGGEFQRHWWQYYSHNPGSFDRVIQSWDCAFKESATSDYVVGQVWGQKGAYFYLLDQIRSRMDINGTLNSIRSMSAKWPNSVAKLVEDKANGSAVIDLLKRQIPGLIPINPQGGKVVRARAVSPYVEAGNVFLPSPDVCPWIHDFVEEFAMFPNSSNDDQVDAMTQALNWLQEHGANGFSQGRASWGR